MKTYTSKLISLLFLVAASIFSVACTSVATKLTESGNLAEKSLNFIAANEAYLSALESNPKQEEARQGLNRTIKNSYDQQLANIISLEKERRYLEANRALENLEQMVLRASVFIQMPFQTADFKQKISNNKFAYSERIVGDAEQSFQGGDYEQAVKNFRQAIEISPERREALAPRIAESHYLDAKKNLKLKKYRVASDLFLSAESVLPSYKDSKEIASKVLFELGEYFLQKKECRVAERDLRKAIELNPSLPKASEKFDAARKCSIVRVAFIEFNDKGIQQIAGMRAGQAIFVAVLSNLQSKKSEFLEIYDRERLADLISERELRRLDSFEGGRLPNLKGVDALLFGKITQALERLPTQSSSANVTGSYGRSVEVPYIDKNGKWQSRYEYRNFPYSYRVTTAQSSAKISGSFSFVRPTDGKLILSKVFNEEEVDRIQYTKGFISQHTLNSSDLTEDARKLSEARQEVLDTSVLAQKIVDRIASMVASEIIEKFDKPSKVTDPSSLRLSGVKI